MGRALVGAAIMDLPWSEELDARLVELWPRHTVVEMADILCISRERINLRGLKLGLAPIRRAVLFAPSKAEWIALATHAATEARVRPSDVMAGSKTSAAVKARWRAWKAALELNPRYTVAGVARTSGWDHSTILHSIKRMGGVSAKDLRKPSYRANCRRSHEVAP